MARTNIEETAWPKFYKLAALIEVHPNMVAGTVAALWHESQESLSTTATYDQLMLWAGLFLETDASKAKWVTALIMFGFIKPTDTGFVIDGNEAEIEVRVSRMTSSAKGAEATRRKWAAKRAGPNGIAETAKPEAERPTEPGVNGLDNGLELCRTPGFTTLNAMQGNAMQSNATQESTTTVADNSGRRDEPRMLGRFPIEEGFLGVNVIDPIISAVSDKAQRQWLRAYPVGEQRAWLIETLTAAIQYYQEKSDYENFGSRIVSWVSRAKKPTPFSLSVAKAADPFALITPETT